MTSGEQIRDELAVLINDQYQAVAGRCDTGHGLTEARAAADGLLAAGWRPTSCKDYEQKLAAFDRVKARCEAIQGHDRYALVNISQIADLLRPDGLWRCSFEEPTRDG
ncbi:hypothetical protein [Amycolatopsis sp. NPDC059657]|uniref:hypothetical protein n=1 Tax=Amycolatopsis sp. NPDC059657 TaxID=3346899 RepID=UPI00366ADBC6